MIVLFPLLQARGRVKWRGVGGEELGEGVRIGHEEDERKEEVYGEVEGVDEVEDKWGARG